jgi:hypothetical protein
MTRRDNYGEPWDTARYYEWERRIEVRRRVIDKYGGACSCCGEDLLVFLDIDHIGGDGKKDREKYGSGGTELPRWLDQRPAQHDKYRVLCRNCNWGAHMNGGVCPHQSMVSGFLALKTERRIKRKNH